MFLELAKGVGKAWIRVDSTSHSYFVDISLSTNEKIGIKIQKRILFILVFFSIF
jgi:hypothetical protein